ncbi:hypothetical protein, partial [Bacillus sp. AFS018417]|uniref:hypothetical protein n=1 Tax=Bacillus sp. AFS018417 TaxID=2033491 RepID=UPI001C3F369E
VICSDVLPTISKDNTPVFISCPCLLMFDQAKWSKLQSTPMTPSDLLKFLFWFSSISIKHLKM